MTPPPPRSTLFPYTTLFRSYSSPARKGSLLSARCPVQSATQSGALRRNWVVPKVSGRSEEHTSELQSQSNLVCRLLLEKKKKKIKKKNNKHQKTQNITIDHT